MSSCISISTRRGFEAGEHNWTPERIRSLRELISRGDLVADPAFDGDGRKQPQPVELPDVPWRADPGDGLRPLRATRAGLGDGVQSA